MTQQMYNPFVNARMELRLDDLLNPAVIDSIKKSGNSIDVTVSKTSLRKLQIVVFDNTPGLSLLQAESATLSVFKGLGIAIREDDPEQVPDESQ